MFCNIDRLGIFQVLCLFVRFLGLQSHLRVTSLLFLLGRVRRNQTIPSTFSLDISSARYPASLLAVRGKWYERGTLCYRALWVCVVCVNCPVMSNSL